MPGNKFYRQQGNNSVFNIAVDEILLHETKKGSSEKEAPEFLDSDYDDNESHSI